MTHIHSTAAVVGTCVHVHTRHTYTPPLASDEKLPIMPTKITTKVPVDPGVKKDMQFAAWSFGLKRTDYNGLVKLLLKKVKVRHHRTCVPDDAVLQRENVERLRQLCVLHDIEGRSCDDKKAPCIALLRTKREALAKRRATSQAARAAFQQAQVNAAPAGDELEVHWSDVLRSWARRCWFLRAVVCLVCQRCE
jgi:hypothetical protein